MNRYDLIKFFIDKIEAYEQAQGELDNLSVEGFNDWMFEQFLSKNQEVKAVNYAKGNEKDINLSVLIGTLFRYVKHYSKKVFEHSTVQSIDEFTYLAMLMSYGSMTKSELIARNVHEKTTGMEILRRLIKNNFVEQTDDLTDKRSQIVTITEGGKIEIIQLFQQMSKVSTLVSGNLSDQEKMILAYLLKKLDIFHRHIYDNEKHDDLNSLINRHFR